MKHKYIISLFLIVFLASCYSNKDFRITKIQESNPSYSNQNYEFPMLTGNIVISEKVNSIVINDLLDLDVNKKNKSIFENVWGTKENTIPTLSFLKYKINTLNKNLYSVTFNSEGCGAYCEEFSISYNFNLSNGNKIILKNLFNKKGKEELLHLLSNKKKKAIEKHLIKLKTDSKSGNKEEVKYINQTIELFENCLKRIPFVSLEYFDFKVINNDIIITSDRCSNHAIRALDDLGDYEYQFKKDELNSFLNDYGRKILKI